MSVFLGIDTSNYTTSVALVENHRVIRNLRSILTVDAGERGLRQSDAVFAHTVNLPLLFEQLGTCRPNAIGVSVTPRDVEGSYMPCFLAGKASASALASVLGVPLFPFSHQRGHIAAALYSCGAEALYDREFLAFHVSGGTTELVHVKNRELNLIGGSADISCGKLIDRVGVMLGLTFPCGKELEKLAESAGRIKEAIKPCVREGKCNLSGAENIAQRMLARGEAKETVAAWTLGFVRETLVQMSASARAAFPGLPIVYAGGVMSNRMIRPALARLGECLFAEPEFSCDNASGVALLCERAWEEKNA